MAVKFANNAVGRLSTPIAAGDTVIPMTPGSGSKFPALGAGDWFPATLVKATGAFEIVKVTAVAGDVLTAVRAQEGTAALAFSASDIVELRPTAAALNTSLDAKLDLTKFAAALTSIIAMWGGAIADIPAGWHLCDGTNGTPDLRDKFIVGAGASYGVGATGGAATVALTWDQMPAHNHGVNDPGHAHGVYDPGHNHGLNFNDPGHAHGIPNLGSAQAGADNGGAPVPAGTGYGTGRNPAPTGVSGTGISVSLNAAATGIGIYTSGTGISTLNAGGSQAHENRPPYYALAYIKYTG